MDTSAKKAFKSQAHHLKPVILVGTKGLTQAVLDETNVALETHELIKVKIKGEDKADKINIAQLLCKQLPAELIQLIGNIAIIYRKKQKN